MPPIDNDVIDLCDSSDESSSSSKDNNSSAFAEQVVKCASTSTHNRANTKSQEGRKNTNSNESRRVIGQTATGCKPRGGSKSSDDESSSSNSNSSSSAFVKHCDDDSASIRSAPRKLPPELHMSPHSKASAKYHQDNVRKNANDNETRRVRDQTATGRQESRESLLSRSREAKRRTSDSSILLVGSIENEIGGNNASSSNNDQRKPKAKSILPKKEEAKSNCIGAGKLLSVAPLKPKNDDDSIISISSTEETSISNKKSIAIKSAKQQTSTLERGASAKQPSKAIRRRRSNNGYQLKEGEQIVWATEKESSKRSHQAIIIHPQPARTSTEITEDMIFIEWLHSPNTFVWLPKANIQYGNENNSDGTTAGKRKRKEPKRLADSMGAMSKLACEKDGRGAFISKKKGTKKGAMKEESQLESNQACVAVIASKKKRAKSRRVTLCKDFTYAKKQRKLKLSVVARAAQAMVRAGSLSAANTKMNDDSDFHGAWWHTNQPKTKPPTKTKTQQSSGELSVPITVVSRDDESSVSSSVSLELPDTSSCSDGSNDGSRVGHEGHQRKVSFAARDTGCHVCASQKHHQGLIEKLLGDLGTFESNPEEEVNWFDIATDFVSRFKVILQGLEDDSCHGTSIFYHRCLRRDAPAPTFTVVKLIQLFDIICQKVSTAFDNCKAPKNDLMQLLFRPWEKSVPKVGVILQLMHLVTREIVNSREEFNLPTSPDELDQLVGVTFGLQLLQIMARNTYFGCKAKLETRSVPSFQFLDQPLESHRTCMKKNCQNQHQRLTGCKVCGIRFHKNCFVCRDIDGKVDTCPTCKASLKLLEAAQTSKLSDIYLLVVERGASPLLPMLSGSLSDTALHAAIRGNNYDVTSMLLFASYILLNCDDSLSDWKIPDSAWGRDGRQQTPFQSGIDTIIKNMNKRPPVEVLLLLCGRGATQTPLDIQQALKTRHRMMIVMTEMDSDNALVKSDISLGLEPQPMSVASTSDFEPSYDIYIGRSFESRCTAIRWFDCRCDFGKQLVSFEGGCAATNLSVLHQKQAVPPSWKSYCNYLCPSRSKGKRMCHCQMAEAGVHCKLEVFKTPDGRGLGVRTAKGVSIKKDQIICHYSGEIITSEESKKRDFEYAKAGHQGSYLLDMDKKRKYTIDATKFRSIAALINHSCSGSNCKLFRAMANHLDTNFPYLGLCAKEDIGELTELTFNYGQKPVGMCSCNLEHCLCRACCVLAHEK